MARQTGRTSAFDTTWQHERKQFLLCRTIGHAWFKFEDSGWIPEWGTPLCVKCERCGMQRRDILNVHGEIGRRYYIRPDGYGLARDEWKPTRAEFRVMVMGIQRESRRAVSKRRR